MKTLTKLMDYKTKQTKNVKTYNPFNTGDYNGTDYQCDGNDEMSHKRLNKKSKFQMKNNKTQFEPIVHSHNKTTAFNVTKSKAGNNKLFMPTSKKTKQQQQHHFKSNVGNLTNTTATAATSATSTTARTAFKGSVGVGGGNNINYASLDRMRNNSCASTQSIKTKNKRKWPFLWWKRYGCYRKPNKSWRLKSKLTCWRQIRKKLLCCKRSSSSSYQYNSDEDDDIDAKFNAYIAEIKLRDAREAMADEPNETLG